MITKKDLQKRVEDLEVQLGESIALKDEAVNKLLEERKHHKAQLEAQAAGQFPLEWHPAPNSPGKPLCVYAEGDDGFTIELYCDLSGNIIGIVALDRYDLETVYMIGMVPAEIIRDQC